MAKQHIDIEKIFEDSFDDFAPKTSKKFDKKMASHIGLSAAVGLANSANLANTASLAKTGGLAKAALIKSTAIIKTFGIIKTVAIIAAVSTTTVCVVNIVEDEKETNNKNIHILEERNERKDLCNLDIMVSKTIHLFDTEVYTEPNYSDLLNSKERNCHIGLIDSKYERDEAQQQLAMNLTEKELNSIENNRDNNLAKENINTKQSSTPLYKEEEESMQNNNSFNKQLSVNNSNETLPNHDKQIEEREALENIEAKFSFAYYNGPKADTIISKNDLVLNTDIPENSSEKNFKNSYQLLAGLHFMPFSYSNLAESKALINDTISTLHIQESSKLSYQFGFDFRLQKKKNPWFIDIGINYQIMKEDIDYYFKRDYLAESLTYWTFDSTTYYIINPPNIDTILNIDSTYYPHWIKGEKSQKNTNSYQYLNIPIMIGYEFYPSGKKYTLEFSTGIAMALHQKSIGYFYNDYGQIINYEDVQLKPAINWYYLASFGINFHIKKTTFFMQPSIKYQLNTENLKNQPIGNKYFIYGIKFGLRFKLF